MEAEKAKRELSSSVQSSIQIENLCDDIDFALVLSRAKLVIFDKFQNFMNCIKMKLIILYTVNNMFAT